MGEFMAMSGVSGCTRTDVVRSLEEFAVSKGGLMETAAPQAAPFDHLVISGDENGPVTVLCPDEDESGKAYESDTFGFNDCWQLTDFMQKLGLSYPIDEEGKIHGDRYRFEVAAEV